MIILVKRIKEFGTLEYIFDMPENTTYNDLKLEIYLKYGFKQVILFNLDRIYMDTEIIINEKMYGIFRNEIKYISSDSDKTDESFLLDDSF